MLNSTDYYKLTTGNSQLMIALLDALLAQTPAADVSGPAPLNLVQTIVLGIVQGLTEFLPISSSAHL